MEVHMSATEETSYSIVFCVLSTILIILAYRYINFLWRRRKLYTFSWNIPGPLAFPFWGNLHLFYGGLNALSKLFDDLARVNPDIFRLWIGPHLLYCILKPEYIEEILCKELEKTHWVNDIVTDDLSVCGLPFLPETLMGVKVDFQTTDSDIGTDISRILKIFTMKIYNVWYHIDIIWKLSPLYSELNYLRKKFRKNYLIEKIHERMSERQENNSLVDEMQDESNKKLPFLDWILKTSDFTETEMKDEIDIFVGAGSDTITVALRCGMVAMGMYQDIQKKVYDEVIEVCGPSRRILPSDLNKLKYTERVVKETLRLFPPSTIMLRNIDTELNLGEHTLPEGASSIFLLRTIHTNPKHWPNPYEFDPDRFLSESIAERHPCTFIPFSYGPRNCIVDHCHEPDEEEPEDINNIEKQRTLQYLNPQRSKSTTADNSS